MRSEQNDESNFREPVAYSTGDRLVEIWNNPTFTTTMQGSAEGLLGAVPLYLEPGSAATDVEPVGYTATWCLNDAQENPLFAVAIWGEGSSGPDDIRLYR
jgi:hypothetical protein